MRRPNLRFIAICVGIVALLVLTAHFVHGYQTKRNAKILLVQARQLRDQKDFNGAAGYYQRYVQLVPDDMTAFAEYGFVLADLPKAHTNAMLVLEQILRRDPDFPDARRKLVDVAMKSGRYADAQVHLQGHLLKQNPKDGELWFQLAQCQVAQQEPKAAVESFRQAIELRPDLWESYARMAFLLRKELEQVNEADQAINTMVEKNPDKPEVYYARAQYWLEYGEAEKAMADAEKAVSLDEKNVTYLLFAAIVAQELKDLDKAEKYATRARKIEVRNPKVYQVASQIALLKSNGDEAVELLKQGLTAHPNHPDLLWELANLQIEQGDFDAARKTVKQLYNASRNTTRPEFLEARILLQKGDVLAAVVRFEQLRAKLPDAPELRKLTDFSLGACYDQIGYVDERVAAYRRVVDNDPRWLPGRFGLAAALASAGRIDEAVENYQQLLGVANGTLAAWQDLARLMIVQQLRLPSEKRSWRRVEEALQKAETISPDSITVPMLRAEMFVAQAKPDSAREALAKASEKKPDSSELWVARAALEYRQGKYGDALKLLDQAESKLGDLAPIRSERIRESLSLDRKAAEDQLAILRKGWDKYTPDDQFNLTRQLASVYSALGDPAQAEALWTQATVLKPEWLPSYLFLFDAVSQQKNQDQLAELLKKIQRIEGKQKGPLWSYGEAARRLLLADTDKSQLDDARNLLAEALVQRPRWARAYDLLAEIEKRSGNYQAASDAYENAVELGERNPVVIRDLVLLLYQQQRFAQADQVIRKLEEQRSLFSTDLDRLASEVSLRVENNDRALELAKKAADGSTSIQDYLWLGQLLTHLQKPQEAEQTYLTAVKQLPQESRAWQALVQHWVRQKMPDKVEQTLRDAADHLPPEQVAIIHAQALSALGKTDAAAEEFQKAIALKPDDNDVLAAAAEFYFMNERYADAQAILQKLTTPESKATPQQRIVARRRLALLLANTGDYAKAQEAMRLLELNAKDAPHDEEDQRVLAIVTAAMPGHESRLEAIRILQQLIDNKVPKAGDRFLLSQLLEQEGRWPEARRQLQSLMASSESQPLYLMAYIRTLLNHKDLQETSVWLPRWEKLHPDDATTAEFRAELDVASGKTDTALAEINKQVDKLNSATARAWGASLLERLAGKCTDEAKANSLYDAAEKLFRSNAQDELRQTSALVNFLARRGRTTEAVDLCMAWAERTADSNPKDALVSAVAVVCQFQAGPDDRKRVEQMVQQQAETQKRPLQLYSALGTLYEAQARYDDALQAYNRALEMDPKDVVALNNLALLLAHSGRNKEAMDLLDRAFKMAGPRAELLDSRGTVHLSKGDEEAAIADYMAAISDKPSPTRWFHLAVAQLHAQHAAEAEKAFQQALSLGLKPEQIHPFDKADYTALNNQFVH